MRKARAEDISIILELITENPETLLPRSKQEIKELLDTTWVVDEEGKVMGSCCLEVYSKKICEVRTLAVKQEARGKGYGKLLVEAAVSEANRLGIPQILTITSTPEFFEKLQFSHDLKEKYALFWRAK